MGTRPLGSGSRHPQRSVGSIRFEVSLWRCIATSSPKDGDRRQNQAENWNRRDALEGGGGRASEQGGVPVSNDRGEITQGERRSADPDQHHAGCYDHEGHYRMRRDAKLATIGVTTIGVHVRHLGHGEQRQQDQAHHSRRAQTSWL